MPPEIEVEFKRLFESEVCIHVADHRGRPARDPHRCGPRRRASRRRRIARSCSGCSTRGPATSSCSGLVAEALDGDQSVMPAIEEALPDWKREARLGVIREPEQTVAEPAWWCSAGGRRPSRRSRPGSPTSSSATTSCGSADRETLAPVDLIERTTGGIRWLPEPGIKRVILAPSYFSRPYNFLMNAADWRFFGYPVADDALEVRDPLAAPAVGRPAPPRPRRRDPAAHPEAARRAGPLPHGDRPAARPVQADDQAPPGAAPVRGPRDDHGVRDRHLLLPPPQSARRRLGGHQAVPHRLGASPHPGGPRAADQSRGPLPGLNVR